MMTEYANPIVNMLIKYGLTKSIALKFAKPISNVDFEEVRARANKLANDENFRCELDKMINKNKYKTEKFINKWLDEHID